MSRRCHIDNKVKLSKGVAEAIIESKTCKAELRYYYCDVCKHYHLTSKPLTRENMVRPVFLKHYKEFKKYLNNG